MTHLLACELLHGLAALREPLEQAQAVEQCGRLRCRGEGVGGERVGGALNGLQQQ